MQLSHVVDAFAAAAVVRRYAADLTFLGTHKQTLSFVRTLMES